MKLWAKVLLFGLLCLSAQVDAHHGRGGPSTPGIVPGAIFPRIGIQAIGGNQYFPTVNLPQLAQYEMIIQGGNYNSWPSQNASNGGYNSRDQVVWGPSGVGGLKNQPHTGKNAVTPLVLQYQDGTDLTSGVNTHCGAASTWFPEWYNQVVTNNWIVYQSGASGAKATNSFCQDYWITNYNHVVGIDSGTGLYPGGYLGLQEYNVFYAGTGGGGAAMASTHIDGIYNDVFPAYWLKGSSAADPLRNSTNPSQTDSTTIMGQSTGLADAANELQSLRPGILVAANTASVYAFTSSCGLGIPVNTNNMAGKFSYNMAQFSVGSLTGTSFNPSINCMGFAVFQTAVALAETQLAPGGAMQLTGAFVSTDYQGLRYSLTSTLMRNNWFFAGLGNNDVIDPGNTATYPVFDEFWGGNLNLAGYLGTAVDPVQTFAYSLGVWCRKFTGGIACVNPVGNGTRTITLPQPYFPENGTQDHIANPGGAAVTTLTLSAGDGRILVTTGPN